MLSQQFFLLIISLVGIINLRIFIKVNPSLCFFFVFLNTKSLSFYENGLIKDESIIFAV